jgi:tetraacyldisaccharide 4'-kinase
VKVVAVGGATLGGSGKTPLAIACAAELARAGASVALVGHAYRARPARARVVALHDGVWEVGDEALVAARALAPGGVRVVVAPRRQEAVALAARFADVLVLDGVAQTKPVRATLALLAVDADEPWGRAAAVAPRGDLRAPMSALVGACDRVVAVQDGGACEPRDHGHPGSGMCAVVSSRGAWVGGSLVAYDELSRMALGLICAIARPERLLRFLARRGVVPVRVLRGPDHGPVPSEARGRASEASEGVDAWLATAKCVLHAPCPLSAPLATLDHGLVLGRTLRQELCSVLSKPV